MRIISGIKKGKKLSLPDPKYTRPLRDQVKENIFNILIHQKKFETEILNSIVVDFFFWLRLFWNRMFIATIKKGLFY